MNVYRKPPRKQQAQADTLPDELPADMQFPDELPADFEFEGEQAQPVQPFASAPTSWIEALFPRSSASADRPAYSGQALASAAQDVASLPGRALASSVRPEGEAFTESMARLQGSPRAGERGMLPGQEISETILRDPVTGALLVAPTWIPARLLAATGRGAALGRGLLAGTQAGGLVAGSRQAERVAGGQGVAPGEIGEDIGWGAGLGAGGQLAGSGLRALGGRTVDAAMKLAKVGKKYREGVEGAFPEMIRRGVLAPTAKGMERNMERIGSDISGRYQTATAGTEGIPAVPLRSYGVMAAQKLEEMAGRGKLGPEDERAAAEWIMARAMRPEAAGAQASPAMVDLPTAIAARSATRKAAGSYESQAPSSARREALQDAADEFATQINQRIAQTNPEVRAVDQYAAPYYQFEPYMDALAARGNNYGIGLQELMAAGVGAGAGAGIGPKSSIGTALALGVASRLQRSPAYPWALSGLGDLGNYVARNPGIGSRLGLGLRGATTDNAR